MRLQSPATRPRAGRRQKSVRRGGTNSRHSSRLPLCDAGKRVPTTRADLHPVAPTREPYSNFIWHPTTGRSGRSPAQRVVCLAAAICGIAPGSSANPDSIIFCMEPAGWAIALQSRPTPAGLGKRFTQTGLGSSRWRSTNVLPLSECKDPNSGTFRPNY